MIKTKKQMYLIIGVFTLVMMLGTITYAFFNYTRTGTANTIKTGRIAFDSSQSSSINLTNAFPISRTTAANDTTNTDEVVITITGDTTYADGLEYLVTATNVTNTIGTGASEKTVPISIIVSANNLGTEDEEYFDKRGPSAQGHLYRILASDTIEENERLVVGYIKSGATGINGTLTIKAYFDSSKIAISDTYPSGGVDTNNDNVIDYTNGTTSEWVGDRVVLTTTEWNSLQTNGVSFQVKVESNEGKWVEEIKTINAMNRFPTVITQEQENIKEVYFNKMGATRMQNAYDAATIKADLTANNEGKVLAWLETNTTDPTKYNLIVASDGDTYFPANISGLFQAWYNTEKIEFNNINTSRVTTMPGLFQQCMKLSSVDLSSWNTENVTMMASLFSGCTTLTTIDLSNLGSNSLSNLGGIFQDCTNLREINMSNFNFGHAYINFIFGGLDNLKTVDLSGAIVSNITVMDGMFSHSSNLERVYVSDTWSVGNVSGSGMFDGCTSLVGQAPNTSYAFDSNDVIDQTYARIATDDQKGYFTDISLKPTN